MGTFGLVKQVGIAGETLKSEFDYFELYNRAMQWLLSTDTTQS